MCVLQVFLYHISYIVPMSSWPVPLCQSHDSSTTAVHSSVQMNSIKLSYNYSYNTVSYLYSLLHNHYFITIKFYTWLFTTVQRWSWVLDLTLTPMASFLKMKSARINYWITAFPCSDAYFMQHMHDGIGKLPMMEIHTNCYYGISLAILPDMEESEVETAIALAMCIRKKVCCLGVSKWKL